MRSTAPSPPATASPPGGPTEPRAKARSAALFQFRFVDGDVEIGGFDMKVLELQPDRHVLWQVVGGPDEWIGTRISWDIRQEGDYAIVMFKHQDWREPVEFMHHCSTKWAIFLMSLKALVETGKGAPNPVDVKIDNWN